MKTSRKTKVYFISVLILATFCSPSVQLSQAAEPTYNGKPLSDWLLLNLSGDASAKEAIRKIGTNAIPTLLDILGATESNKRRVVSKLKSEELHQGFRGQYADVGDLRNIAVDGFKVLGTNAESAVPRLTKLFRDPETCEEAARVLTQVGTKGFAVVTNALNDEDLAGVVVLALQNGGGDPKVITQLLIYALKNPSPTTRGNAANFLAGKDATLAVPALIPMLDDHAHYPKERATIALGSFGPAAKSAAPKLLALYMNDPDVHTNGLDSLVLSALRNIDPETAGKAETFLVKSGPLNGARSSYTRTPLPNGKELIAGGVIHTEIPTITNRHLSGAELYDPAIGKWTETGEMNTARNCHLAILLRNGKVLVAGGSDSRGSDLSSAELYDPATGKWTKTGSMNAAHPSDRMALEPNGKVLVFRGGWNGGKKYNQELYDPATGKWTTLPAR